MALTWLKDSSRMRMYRHFHSVGSEPVKTLQNVDSVTLGLSDHPVIIAVEPQSR